MFIRRLLLVLLALAAANTYAANWYVSPTGSDSAAGTSSSVPFATFAKGVTAMSGGDTLWCMPGSYAQQLIVNKSGTSSNPLTVQSLGPGACTITNVGSGKIAIFVSNQQWIVFNGINVNGGQLVSRANTVSANHCVAASFAPGGAPNVQTWIGLEGAQNIVVENGTYQYATGYWGVEITGFYLASGQPDQTNTPAELSGTAQNITIQNNSFSDLGNLLDQTATCGDIIDVYNSANVTNHLLIQNNTFRHASHNAIEIYGSNSIIQYNVLDGSWADLYPSGLAFGVFAGYRTMENNGSNNILQGNVFENAGANANPPDHMPPIVDMHGSQGLYRRNIFYNGVGNGINTDCGYGNLDTVIENHYVHNDIIQVNSQAISYSAYSGDPCVTDGKHVWINNIIYNDRMNPTSSGGQIIQVDADVFHNLTGATGGFANSGLGNIGQITYSSNLWAPSLTSPTVVSSRPASIWNSAISGQSPMCFQGFGITGCPNATPAETTFSTFITTDNIDAGLLPVNRPIFVTATPSAYADFALTAISPGVDQGKCLTTTTGSGSASTTIPVADAYFFTAGLGLITGDLVELCTHGTTTTVTAITYGTYPAGTLTVSPAVTFNSGEGVTYPYTGTSPDIGAIELSSGGGGAVPPVTQPKTWTIFICASDGKVYSDPSRCH